MSPTVFRRSLSLPWMLTLLAVPDPATAAVVVGDIAIVARQNNIANDPFAFVALRSIAAGETVYFTDNGWNGTRFRGADSYGNGFEDLMMWTANQTIAAGTLIRSTATHASYTWTTSGTIPGAASGSFSRPNITQAGDQIYAFTAGASNPLSNPSVHLFVLDDTGAFETAGTARTGDLPTGGMGVTVIPAGGEGPIANTVALGTIRVGDLSGTRTATEWMDYIRDPANWVYVSGTAELSGLASGITVSAVPEPLSAAWLGGGCLVGALAHRRRRMARRVASRTR